MLLYLLITVLLIGVILVAVLQPISAWLIEEFQFNTKLVEAVNAWLYGEKGTFAALFTSVENGLKANFNIDRYLAILYGILIYTGIVFFVNFTFLPISKSIYSKLLKGNSEKFLYSVFSSFKKSLVFAPVYSLLTGIWDGAFLFAAIYVGKLFSFFVSFLAVPVGVLFFFAMHTLRTAALSQWVPEILSGGGVLRTLGTSIKVGIKNIRRMYPTFYMVSSVLFLLSFFCGVLTFGVAAFIALPIYVVLLNILFCVSHFEITGVQYHKLVAPQVDTEAAE